MDERFWHRNYDPKVPASLECPKVPLHRFLDDAAAKYPDRVAITFLGKQITYGSLLRSCNAFARGLRELGVRKGDRVALYLPNVPHIVIGYYGAFKAGAICVPTNPLYTERELTYQLKDSGAKVLVTLDLDLTLSKVRAVKDSAGLKTVIVGRVSDYLPFPKNLLYPVVKRKDLTEVPAENAYVHFRDLAGTEGASPPDVAVEAGDPAVLMYTGGTTGVSKGAVLTHANLVTNTYHLVCWASAGEMNDTPQDSVMAVLPLFHSFGMTVCMNTSIMMAGRLILFPTRPKPDASDLLEMVRDEQPGYLPGVPALFTAMANNPRANEYKIDCIKGCMSAAAPLPVEILQKFEAMTGGKIFEGYGLSETSPVAAANPRLGLRKAGSVGLPFIDTEIRIVDQVEGKKEMPLGESGEILIKGPQVMKGYWNRPEETKASLRDGWLYTGDIGRMDEDGYVFIVDRKKDMIITGGFNVYPREVEEILYEHPKVLEAGVIGVPDERSGERVKAFVVLKEGQTATAEEIIEFCRTRLTPYKVPKWVELRPELPKNNVGKLLRRVLREGERPAGLGAATGGPAASASPDGPAR